MAHTPFFPVQARWVFPYVVSVPNLIEVLATLGHSHRRPRLLCCLGLWLVLYPSSAVGAQAPSADHSPQRITREAEYRQLIRDGVAEFDRQNWSEARAFFERAHALKPSARTLRGLGFVAYEMHNYVEAESLLAKALRTQNGALTRAQRKHTQALLSKVHAFIGRYTLELTPPNVELLLDGRPSALPTGRLRLNVGEHRLIFQHPGYLDAELRLDVRGGEEETLKVELRLDRLTTRPKAPVPAAPLIPHPMPRPAPEPAESSSWLESPWFWAGLVTLAAAGGVALGFHLTAGDAPSAPAPNTGVKFATLGAAP